MSLSELLVTMGLMTIAGSMATFFLVSSSRASNMTLERGYNVAQARLTLASWSGLLKVADSFGRPGQNVGRFAKITPTTIEFFASLDNRNEAGTAQPTRIVLTLENGELVERHYDATTGVLESTRNLATGASTDGWMFTPYNGTSALPLTELDCLSDDENVAGFCGSYATDGSGTQAGEARLQQVTRIDIAFRVSDRANLAPTSFVSSIAIGH
jgi:hypothetical protein